MVGLPGWHAKSLNSPAVDLRILTAVTMLVTDNVNLIAWLQNEERYCSRPRPETSLPMRSLHVSSVITVRPPLPAVGISCSHQKFVTGFTDA